jgi:hypothetical protein
VNELPSWNQHRVQPYNLFVFEPDPRQEGRQQLQNWNSIICRTSTNVDCTHVRYNTSKTDRHANWQNNLTKRPSRSMHQRGSNKSMY